MTFPNVRISYIESSYAGTISSQNVPVEQFFLPNKLEFAFPLNLYPEMEIESDLEARKKPLLGFFQRSDIENQLDDGTSR